MGVGVVGSVPCRFWLFGEVGGWVWRWAVAPSIGGSHFSWPLSSLVGMLVVVCVEHRFLYTCLTKLGIVVAVIHHAVPSPTCVLLDPGLSMRPWGV